MVRGDEKSAGELEADVELAEVVKREAVIAADTDDFVGIGVADAGNAEDAFARRGIDVDGKELAGWVRAQVVLGSSRKGKLGAIGRGQSRRR